ncbi:MAG: tRNA dihydrouridine(20/20a) synthase DusA [Pseudomonadota bacterium]
MTTHTLCIAPMMEWTDRHYRYLVRLMTKHTRLYTEMITSGALIHGDRERFLKFDHSEHPIALQIGGSDADEMRQSAIWGAKAGYDEININVGCPSDRVQSGGFGVYLMREPDQVAKCVKAMQQEVDIPVTVKCRIGMDHDDSYEFLTQFIEPVTSAGCNTFIIHARKAWLTGLSPKQNREVPELDYQRVYQLKQDYPDLNIIINGGIESVDEVKTHLEHVDGVMIGRQAYKHPYFLLNVDKLIYQDDSDEVSLQEVVTQYADYVEANLRDGVHLKSMTKHILNLYQGVPGAKHWRRHLSEHAHQDGRGVELIYEAHEKMKEQSAFKQTA